MGYYGDMAEEVRRSAEEERRRKAGLSQVADGQQLRNMTYEQLAGVQNRAAPQAAGTTVGNVATGTAARVDPTQQAQFRASQLGLANRLLGIGSGAQMGAGEMAAMRQGNRAAAQQIGMARMQRGAGAALAARGAMRNAGNIGLATAGQAQQAALQDQQIANQTAAQLLGQGREQDIGLAGQNAQLRQQMNLANLDAKNQQIFQQAGLDQATSLANMQSKLQTMGMNDQAAIAYMAQLYGISLAEMQARVQYEIAKMSQPQKGSTLGGLMTVGGTIIGGIAGGPGGAAAGGQAGSAVGGTV